MHPRRIVWPVLALIPVLRSPGFGGGAEYLIVERPAALVVYDRYQQSLSADARRALPRFLPMRILSRRELLGDGLTPCTNVEIRQGPAYLLLDEKGSLAGESGAGHIWHLKDATTLDDTVSVLRSRQLKFEPPSGGMQQFLSEGEKLARVFEVSGRTYVWRASLSMYGWVTIRPGDRGVSWEPPPPAAVSRESISVSRLQDSIRSRLASVNHLLARIFSHFNEELRTQRIPPQWTFHASGDTLICQLEGTPTPGDFSESTAVLSKTLSDLVIGTRFTVVSAPGAITILPG